MTQKNPWTWGYTPPVGTEPEAPVVEIAQEKTVESSVEPGPEWDETDDFDLETDDCDDEPEVELELEIAPEAPWTHTRSHATLGETVPDGIALPDSWDEMNLAQKKIWLDENAR